MAAHPRGLAGAVSKILVNIKVVQRWWTQWVF
jgi:hypothetical protein